MRNAFLALCLLAALGVGAWRYFEPAAVPTRPFERLQTTNPVDTIRRAKPSPPATPMTRSAPAEPAKMSAQRAQMEDRFNELKEEGRRVRQALIDSDPKAAQAYETIYRQPEYRALLDRRHQIEAVWASAPENERDGMLKEMNSLRQQGFTLILGEIQRLQSQPAAPVANGATTSAPAAVSAPAAPAAPVVFQ